MPRIRAKKIGSGRNAFWAIEGGRTYVRKKNVLRDLGGKRRHSSKLKKGR